MKKDYLTLPLLPLRDVVIYPNMVVPLFVGRDLSIKSLDESMKNHDKNIVLVTQKSAETDNPSIKDLYSIRKNLFYERIFLIKNARLSLFLRNYFLRFIIFIF